MSKTSWYVGQKIACIHRGMLKPDEMHDLRSLFDNPQEVVFGRTYTIKKIWAAANHSDDFSNGLAFWLEEIPDEFCSYHEELFRPCYAESVKAVDSCDIKERC